MDGVNREQGDATPAAVKRTGEGGLGWLDGSSRGEEIVWFVMCRRGCKIVRSGASTRSQGGARQGERKRYLAA